MSKLLRYFEPGQTIFITAVTHDRQPCLLRHEDLLLSAFRRVFGPRLSNVRAWAILPDHFHTIVDFPNGDAPSSIRRVKLVFGKSYRERLGLYRATVWQKRYWDHIIRDESDLRNHIDYVHYNPVKHGFSPDPFSYAHSTASRYLNDGMYESDWGQRRTPNFEGEFGE